MRILLLLASLAHVHDVFLARVLSVDRAPGFWSGDAIARQRVHARVEAVRTGAMIVGHDLDVDFTIVAGAPEVDPQGPQLRTDWFAPGKHLVVTETSFGGVEMVSALPTP